MLKHKGKEKKGKEEKTERGNRKFIIFSFHTHNNPPQKLIFNITKNNINK